MADIVERVELVGGPFDGLGVEVKPGALAVFVQETEERCACDDCDEKMIALGYRAPGEPIEEMPDGVSIYVPIEQGSCRAGHQRRFEHQDR